ncbi:MAG: D-alanyl-D-alanine carboxypeptidase family protein [Coriobacteriia bacterium]|nr:D-alanyl-D-alanine carboxypeptidase family protein [Coriobacteriia bacterium]
MGASAAESVGGVSIDADPALAAAVPAVSMPAGVLRTADGRTLWDRDAGAERAMASTTKIMTALVVLDRTELTERVTVTGGAAGVGEAEAGLVAGESYTVQQLLEAMLVRSGNDAALALAEHVAGDEDAFVALMNEKAVALGLSETAFTNPHGLDEDGHHTSAADLATLTTVAMADPRFAAIVNMLRVNVTAGGRTTTFESSNKLLGTYEGATGVKTGWTSDAGYCLVASAQRGSVSFIAVVLGTSSEDARFEQARTLLDWGFAHYAETQVAAKETTAGLVPVTDYLDRTVTAKVAEDAVVSVFDLDGEVVSRVDMIGEVEAPVVAGQRLGTLTVVQGERLLAQVPIVAAGDVPAPDAWDAAGIWFTRLWRRVFGGDLQASAVPVL